MLNNQLKEDLQQKKAIEQIKENIYVTASAGSGKTRVLTERFIYILDNDSSIDIEEIIAITYTEKAANEMKERIYNKILEKIEYYSNNSNKLKRWIEIKNNFRSANISTIHSFCSKLIREYPIESEINPDFEIVSEVELQLSMFTYVKDLITNLIEEKEGGNLLFIIHQLIKIYDISKLTSLLVELLINETRFETFYKHTFDNLKKENYLNIVKTRIERKKQEYLNHIINSEELSHNIEYLLSFNIQSYNCSDKRGNYSNQIKEFILTLGIIKKGGIVNNINIPKGDSWKNITTQKVFGEDWEDLKSNLEAIIDILPQNLFKLNTEDISNDISYDITRDIVLLYDYVKKLLHDKSTIHRDEILIKRKNKSLLTFDDLQTVAFELLSNTRIRNNITSKYKYIMVDECQDIDFTQNMIIKLLAYPDIEKKPNLFIVGDGKQSIYKFRGADVSTFNNLMIEISKNKQNYDNNVDYNLYTNYRSIKPLVGFTNRFFSKLMLNGPDDFEIEYGKYINANREIEIEEPPIELLISLEDYGEDEAKLNNRTKEANMIGNRIAQLINNDGISPYRIAILLRSLNQSLFYEKALSERNIKYQVVEGKGFFTRQEIKDCINLLRTIDNERDEIALLSVLRSPFCSISDLTLLQLMNFENDNPKTKEVSDTSKSTNKIFYCLDNYRQFLTDKREQDKIEFIYDLINRLRKSKDRLKVSYILRKALTESGYMSSVLGLQNGLQKRANLEKFIELISNLEDSKNFLLYDLINYLDKLIDILSAESDASIPENKDSVTIMTIHKSKGLEFDYVFVPRLDYRDEYNSGDIIFDIPKVKHLDSDTYEESFGLAIPYISKETITSEDDSEKPFSENTNMAYEFLKVIEKNKQNAEFKRLLYVAFTRAKEKLIASSKINIKKNKDGEQYITPKRCSINSSNPSWIGWFLYICGINDNELLNVKDKVKFYKIDNENIYTIFDIPNTNFKKESEKYIKINKDDINISLPNKEKLNYVTATSLITYKQCPRKYFYKFLKRIRETSEGIGKRETDDNIINNNISEQENDDKIMKKSIPLNMIGNIVHNLLEKYDNKEDFVGIISSEVSNQKLSVLSDKKRKQTVIDHINNILTDFTATDLYKEMLISRKNYPESYFNELNFHIKIDDITLEGSIDKIFKDKDGKLIVLDYKTNRFDRTKNIEKLIEEKAEKYQLQLDIYTIVTEKLLREKVEKAKLYFLDLQREYSRNAKNIDDITNDLRKRISEIKEKIDKGVEEKNFEAIYDSHDCLFCGYWMCENKKSKN